MSNSVGGGFFYITSPQRQMPLPCGRLDYYWPMRLPLWIFPALCLLAHTGTAKMNVVFILVDDWGWADAGVQGSDFFETPNIDKFARKSLRFTQAYAAAAICSPTRAAIMTGKSPARLDMTIWHEGAMQGGPKKRRQAACSQGATQPVA